MIARIYMIRKLRVLGLSEGRAMIVCGWGAYAGIYDIIYMIINSDTIITLRWL